VYQARDEKSRLMLEKSLMLNSEGKEAARRAQQSQGAASNAERMEGGKRIVHKKSPRRMCRGLVNSHWRRPPKIWSFTEAGDWNELAEETTLRG
jgi:hypothetical protein